MSNVHFNNSYEDKNYIEELSQSLSRAQKETLLKNISPRTQKKIHNMDDGETKLREYLLITENDNSAPAAPDFPFPLIDFSKIQIPVYPFPNQVDGVEVSNREPQYYKPGAEPENRKDIYAQRLAEKRAQEAAMKRQRDEEAMLLSSKIKDDKERKKAEDLLRKQQEKEDKERAKQEKLENSLRRSQEKEAEKLRRSQEKLAESQSKQEEKEHKRIEKLNQKQPSKEKSPIQEIQIKDLKASVSSSSSSSVVRQRKHHLVEVSDLSEYFRFKETKNKCFLCCDWRWCCLFMFLTLISTLLVIGLYISYSCCVGRLYVGQSVGSKDQHVDPQLYVQLRTLGEQVNKLKEEMNNQYKQDGNNQVFDLKSSNEYLDIMKQINEIRKKEDPSSSDIKKKLTLIENKLNTLPQQQQQGSVDTSNLVDLIETEVEKRISFILSKLQKDGEAPQQISSIDSLFNKYTIINHNRSQYISVSSSLHKKNPLSHILERTYLPGQCWATNNPAEMKYAAPRPFKARYLVVGHPQAQFLENGRASAPYTIKIQFKRMASNDPLDVKESTEFLEEIKFDLNGAREQSFDLSKFGWSVDKVATGFSAKVDGQETQKNLCLYSFMLLGEYVN